MIIAIASGKGGTGKTTLSVSLALSAPGSTALLDCDVEEPNADLFLSVTDRSTHDVTSLVPVIDAALCTACGACARLCEFNAIVCIGSSVMVFNELCHSCGLCARVCPHQAIREAPHKIGSIEEGRMPRSGGASPLYFAKGLLDIGKAMSPPVIRAVTECGERWLKEFPGPESLIILDSPPGTSCPMTTTVSDADCVVLVTEPTPFGLHDLTLAVETVRKMGIPFGVVINRCDSGDDRVVRYCEAEQIPLLLSIPEDRLIAEAYSRGIPLVDAHREYREQFVALFEACKKLSGRTPA